jgi:outer membrane protein TolC
MFRYPCHSRLIGSVSLLALLVAGNSWAAPLELVEAQHLALDQQPQILAQQAQARADRAAAIAVQQLPDPKLALGVKDLPVTSADAYSFTRDNFTMLEVGVSQDFPLADKRRLQGEGKLQEAEVSDAKAAQLRREIGRGTGLAWLDVFRPERAATLADEQQLEAERLAQLADFAYRNGKASQSDVLAANVSVEMLADKAAGYRQQARESRGILSRWIGASAEESLPQELPAWPTPPELPELLAHVEHHPHLEVMAKQAAVAQTGIKLAEQAYYPDWSVEAYYANRPAFSDFVGVRVTVDLPFLTANRQDQRLQENRALLEKATADREDTRRVHAAEARSARALWEDVTARLNHFDNKILPQSQQTVSAALAAYGAGQASLASVLQARQTLLDTELQRLDLAVDAARAQLRLRYFFE